MRELDLVDIQRSERSQEKLQMHEFEVSDNLGEQLLKLPTLFNVAEVICAATSRLIKELERLIDDFKNLFSMSL